ncbi:hypothetical protein [Marinovum sp.]|uniref:hypothetical protein n=1 Tax=Marinovum sp. TaxID=2024839 RepID=UPI002B27A8E0|nr:hypothetical protein [Marinovum sp.]
MAYDFRAALLWHLKHHQTRIAELARNTGLKTRAGLSTTVENAVRFAEHYGKSVDDFIRLRENNDVRRILAMLDQLQPDEHRLVIARASGNYR